MPKVKEHKNKYTLNDLLVKDYIIFRAMQNPYLRTQIYGDKWKDITTQAQLLKANGLSEKSEKILRNITKLLGFSEAVNKEKTRIYKRFVNIAHEGIYKRAKGMYVQKQTATRTGEVVDLTQELEPSEKACELILKVFDGFKDKTEVSIIDETQKKWVDAARGIDKGDEEEPQSKEK